MTRRSLTIDVHIDVVCPWCLVATDRLERVLAQREDVDATVTYLPFLLEPDLPPGGGDLKQLLRRRYRMDPSLLYERAEKEARASGIPLDLSKVPRIYRTDAAHTLLRHAEPRGTQRALARALFAAYFFQLRDVSDVEELAAIAALHGFTADEATRLAADEVELAATRGEAAEAVAQGIRVVPHFVFAAQWTASGAITEGAMGALIDKSIG
jgi:predicted DsbA family dithiol-disulfide isomerase